MNYAKVFMKTITLKTQDNFLIKEVIDEEYLPPPWEKK
ncbi:hypothetical protein CRYPD_132 [uncultured Candidatus Thioglobus sp.]|nr:hypothetical protein CRYPD_132 [uncultured Candidatus Thioglobus sp.]